MSRICQCWVLLCALDALCLRADDSDARIDFNRQIRSILSENCLQCHGPDEAQREAELRLDSRQRAVARLPSGKRAIEPGNSRTSELIRRVTATDPDIAMPPPDVARRLSAEQVALLRRWIDEGADWQTHWAYTTPRRAKLVSQQPDDWSLNAIDTFTLARMNKHGLRPSPAASREQWLRRVTLDLTGFPPTLDELNSFLADRSPDAHDQVVDRLLASPRYGERMALPWLDLARYADTHGFHTDSHRDMWRWRAWVINALNENLPFDTFTVWQIAGDLLPNATLAQRIATGFNRNHMINYEEGAIPDEYRTEYVVDRVVTTTTVWLGQTMICARCHDHKYDPFSQRDFYRLFAYFNNIPELGLDGQRGNAVPFIKAPTRFQQRRLDKLNHDVAAVSRRLEARAAGAAADQRAWERELLAGEAELPAPPSDVLLHLPLNEGAGDRAADAGPKQHHGKIRGEPVWSGWGKYGDGLVLNDQSFIDAGDVANFGRRDSFSCGAWVFPTTSDEMTILARCDKDANYRGFELALKEKKVFVRMIGQSDNDVIQVRAAEALNGGQWHHVLMTYDGSSNAAGIRIFVNGRLQAGVTVYDQLSGAIQVRQPLLIGRRHGTAPFRGMIDEVRVYARALSASEVALLAGANPIMAIVRLAQGQRSKTQQSTLRQYYLDNEDAAYQVLAKQLADLRRTEATVRKSIPTTMVMQEMAKPRDTFILKRGDYRFADEQVTCGTPASLPALREGWPRNRLGLARWLVDPQNPLTARVTVNRFWQLHFGAGLVGTPEDFGTRGALPTHPQLLDWLATEFVRSGWDVKHMHRLITLSATYRQSSRLTLELMEADPENRLLARGPSLRLPAELVRDHALFVSGLLQEKVGGISVYPYQPAGLWKEVSQDPFEYTAQVYVQSHGADLYRRSLYTFWKRSSPPPAMSALGAGDREVCVARRAEVSTPLDALVQLNDPTYVEAARALAERMMTQAGPGPRERLAFGFRLATSRRPSQRELNVLLEVFHEQLAENRTHKQDSQKLLKVGESVVNKSLPVDEVAAYSIVASMILNLSEVNTRG